MSTRHTRHSVWCHCSGMGSVVFSACCFAFVSRLLEGLNLWHGSKFAGLFILIVIIELSDLRRSKLERKSVLFFLIMENTHSSPALLCGIVKTANATLQRFGSFYCKLPHIMSIRWYVTSVPLSSNFSTTFDSFQICAGMSASLMAW